ncbi:MAG: ABC transporter substrate-binding protein [Candidatus Eiseniibacteriota bacterium]
MMRSTRRAFLAGAGTIGLAAALPRRAFAADKLKVAIGQKGVWDSMITVFGIEQGLFKAENIDVDITWTRGGSETLQTVITKSCDFAMTNGTTGVMAAFVKGAAIRIVGAEANGANDLFWYVKKDSPIKTMADANGKTMGFSRPGSSSNTTAVAIADAFKVKPKIVPTGGMSETRTQVMSGQIDIGWSAPPGNLDLVEKGELRIIATGADAPELRKQTVRVNVVSAELIKENRKLVERFMRGYVKGLDWMYANLDKAIARYAVENKVDPKIARIAVEKFYTDKSAFAISPILGIDRSMQEGVESKHLAKPLTQAQLKELIDIVYKPA